MSNYAVVNWHKISLARTAFPLMPLTFPSPPVQNTDGVAPVSLHAQAVKHERREESEGKSYDKTGLEMHAERYLELSEPP